MFSFFCVCMQCSYSTAWHCLSLGWGSVQAASGGEGAGPGPSSQEQQEQEQQQQQEGQQRQGGAGVKKHIGSNTMGMVLDLLCFCVQHHGYRSAPTPHCV